MFMWAARRVSRLSYRIQDFQDIYGRKHFGWTIRPFLDHPRWVADRKTKPIQYFLVVDCLDVLREFLRYRVAPVIRRPSYRFERRQRYHLIDTKLEPGYYDIDTLMLHGMMALLERYVVDEMGGEDKIAEFNAELRDPDKQDPNAPEGVLEHQADIQEEALTIYRWWKYQRPREQKAYDDLIHEIHGKHDMFAGNKWNADGTLMEVVPAPARSDLPVPHEMEERLREQDQMMLHRLIDIRGSLWT